MQDKITSDEYARLVAACTAEVLDTGRTVDDVITNPRGAASSYVHVIDLDSLYAVVSAAVQAIGASRYGAQWVTPRQAN